MFVCHYFISLISIIQEKEPDFQLDFLYMEQLPQINMLVAHLIEQDRQDRFYVLTILI